MQIIAVKKNKQTKRNKSLLHKWKHANGQIKAKSFSIIKDLCFKKFTNDEILLLSLDKRSLRLHCQIPSLISHVVCKKCFYMFIQEAYNSWIRIMI